MAQSIIASTPKHGSRTRPLYRQRDAEPVRSVLHTQDGRTIGTIEALPVKYDPPATPKMPLGHEHNPRWVKE